MKKYKVYVTSAYRYFADEKAAIEFVKALLKINLGGEIMAEDIVKEK